MGRSVSVASGADAVAYREFGPETELDEEFRQELGSEEEVWDFWEYESGEYYDLLLEWVRERCEELFPSMYRAEDWDGREVRIVCENSHSFVGVAWYCGIVSISLAGRQDSENLWSLGEKWRKQISERFVTEFSDLQRVGVFNNGESVYSRVER